MGVLWNDSLVQTNIWCQASDSNGQPFATSSVHGAASLILRHALTFLLGDFETCQTTSKWSSSTLLSAGHVTNKVLTCPCFRLVASLALTAFRLFNQDFFQFQLLRILQSSELLPDLLILPCSSDSHEICILCASDMIDLWTFISHDGFTGDYYAVLFCCGISMHKPSTSAVLVYPCRALTEPFVRHSIDLACDHDGTRHQLHQCRCPVTAPLDQSERLITH